MIILAAKLGAINNKIKLLKLIVFDGTYSKLRIFLVNIEMYIKVN
jgi:hypothetical protein